MKYVTASEARKKRAKTPDYRKIIQAPDADHADKWGWKWTDRRGLMPVSKR